MTECVSVLSAVSMTRPRVCHGSNTRSRSRIQSRLGFFSRAKSGSEQRVAQLRHVGHVRATENRSSRRDEICGAGPQPIGGRRAEIIQVVVHGFVNERKQNVVALSLYKPAQSKEFYPARPPGGDQCDHLISRNRLQVRVGRWK